MVLNPSISQKFGTSGVEGVNWRSVSLLAHLLSCIMYMLASTAGGWQLTVVCGVLAVALSAIYVIWSPQLGSWAWAGRWLSSQPDGRVLAMVQAGGRGRVASWGGCLVVAGHVTNGSHTAHCSAVRCWLQYSADVFKSHQTHQCMTWHGLVLFIQNMTNADHCPALASCCLPHSHLVSVSLAVDACPKIDR